MIGRRVPAAVQVLADGGKPLAWANTTDGWVVATAEQLVLPAREPQNWEDVIRAAWNEPVLEVQLADGIVRVTLAESGRIPQVVNERVKASVLIQHHVPLVGDKGVRLVARRPPGGTDVRWRVTFDPGLDPSDPQLRAAADDALTELRASIGL
jgi:hypothetical protein